MLVLQGRHRARFQMTETVLGAVLVLLTTLYRCQKDGTGSGLSGFNAATALQDGSVILAGFSNGDWDGVNQGEYDSAAVKLSSLGVEEWRWQVNLGI